MKGRLLPTLRVLGYPIAVRGFCSNLYVILIRMVIARGILSHKHFDIVKRPTYSIGNSRMEDRGDNQDSSEDHKIELKEKDKQAEGPQGRQRQGP